MRNRVADVRAEATMTRAVESGRVAASSIGTIGSNCGRHVRARRDPGRLPPDHRLDKYSVRTRNKEILRLNVYLV